MKAKYVFKDIIAPFFASLFVEITMIFIQSKMNNINIFNIILYILFLLMVIGFIIYRIGYKKQIIKIYDDNNSVRNDIIKNCDKSTKIIFWGIRGRSFSHLDGYLHKYLLDNNKDKIIIIANPQNKYLQERASDINVDIKSYISDIKSSINIIDKLRYNKHIKLILHSEKPLFSYVLLDDFLYLSFYQYGQTISKSKVYKAGKNSELYKIFKKHSDSYIN